MIKRNGLSVALAVVNLPKFRVGPSERPAGPSSLATAQAQFSHLPTMQLHTYSSLLQLLTKQLSSYAFKFLLVKFCSGLVTMMCSLLCRLCV